MARTVVFDFDGVIHSYTSGWQGEDAIPDPPVPGIREALKEINDAGYEVVVVSTRCATIKGHRAIEAWLYDNGLREYIDKVCKEKPPAVAYIDDRAICFDGHPETLLKKIQNFQPWYKMPTLTPPNEWVSVEERLPTIEKDYDGYGSVSVNVFNGKTVLPMDWESSVVRGKKVFRWKYPWGRIYDGTPITHWMPLPERPKEDQK